LFDCTIARHEAPAPAGDGPRGGIDAEIGLAAGSLAALSAIDALLRA